ncbi:MAG TPA: glycosyltransferase family 2 protein [Nanoarchaeota archaeon]|nr:glycosyltransferase family 2 protein [Nanoarchaeota archaeon]
MKKKLTIIIPALNEEKAIGKVIDEIPKKELKCLGLETEILVVDNGSTDSTRKIALGKGARVIIQPVCGYGNAYKAGFANASGDIIATCDADMTYPVKDIPKFVIEVMNGTDFITTNRFASMDAKAMPRRNNFGNKVLTFTTNTLFGLKLQDSQSGMWIFKKRILKKLNLKSGGMSFSQEIKIEAFRKTPKSKEVPIHYRERVGEVKLKAVKDGLRNLGHLFKKRVSK